MTAPPPLETLVQSALLYVILPAWALFGFLDYLCHRRSRIETTTGLRENFLHCVMGLQVGLAIFFGLFFEVNVGLLLIMLAVLVLHEIVAHIDVRSAYEKRAISVWEMHAHSFLEVIPFAIFGLVVLLKWPAFVALVTLDWGGGHLALTSKRTPLSSRYLMGYVVFMLVVGVLPYMEESLRCWRHRARAAA